MDLVSLEAKYMCFIVVSIGECNLSTQYKKYHTLMTFFISTEGREWIDNSVGHRPFIIDSLTVELQHFAGAFIKVMCFGVGHLFKATKGEDIEAKHTITLAATAAARIINNIIHDSATFSVYTQPTEFTN